MRTLTIRQRLHAAVLLLVLLLAGAVGLGFWIQSARSSGELRQAQLLRCRELLNADALQMLDALRKLCSDPANDSARLRKNAAAAEARATLTELRSVFAGAQLKENPAEQLEAFLSEAAAGTLGSFDRRLTELLEKDPTAALGYYNEHEPAINNQRLALYRELSHQTEHIGGVWPRGFAWQFTFFAMLLAVGVLVLRRQVLAIARFSAREEPERNPGIGEAAQRFRNTLESSRNLSNRLEQLDAIVTQSAQLTSNSHKAADGLALTLQQSQEACAAVISKLGNLGERTKSINAVLTVIGKVADQTNLLSLNAAIEAEKAGEYGLAFAVVATEIRRLADQTAVAANDIEKIVGELQAAAAAGAFGIDRFSEELRRAREQSRDLARVLEELEQRTRGVGATAQTATGAARLQAQELQHALDQLSGRNGPGGILPQVGQEPPLPQVISEAVKADQSPLRIRENFRPNPNTPGI